ncbi:MAG: purine-nucleoside phosphorylase [Clostridia bacterium]|nr:purine-nucleoside phosphorylase [Clostridia bacterium]
MNNTPTPHIKASPGDFAPTVLMPGDPLRSRFIAENYLDNAVLVNDVRGVQGYTGRWKGKPVSVMASGMGIPSIGIYSYELFNFFGVENIIRIGSAGSYSADVHVGDIILAMGACTNSNYASQFGLDGSFAPVADYRLLSRAHECYKAQGTNCHIGNVLSSDIFYSASSDAVTPWARMGVLAVEMEAAGLYMNAAYAGKSALAILTVSDSLVTGEAMSSDERTTALGEMIEGALDTAISV